jgi:hypothetical protein
MRWHDFDGLRLTHIWCMPTLQVPRLSVGALLGKILQNMQLHLSEPSPSGSGPKDETDEMDDHSKQLHIFSGHDDTIGGILAALQVKDWGWPPYASNILIELWKGENGYAVRVIYNGKQLQLPFCSDELCPLDVFEQFLLRHLIPNDLATECLM